MTLYYGGPFDHAKIITDAIRTDRSARLRYAGFTENSFVQKRYSATVDAARCGVGYNLHLSQWIGFL